MDKRRGNLLFSTLFIFALIIIFLFTASIDIPVIIDDKDIVQDTNNTETRTNIGADTFVEFNHTVRPLRSNRVVVVTTAVDPGTAEIDNVTYAGETLTQVRRSNTSVSSAIYILEDPPTGTHLVNLTGFGDDVTSVVAGSSTYTGVDTGTPYYSVSNNTGMSDFPNSEIDATAEVRPREDDVIVDSLSVQGDSANPEPISNQTVLYNEELATLNPDRYGAASFLESDGDETIVSWELDDEYTWAYTVLVLNGDIIDENLAELERLLTQYKDVALPAVLVLLLMVTIGTVITEV